MKILALRGKNLASLAGEFEVDFSREPLAGAGLFAISGPTGSGKSTLLDALCLALYGQTPRLAEATGGQIPDVENAQVMTSDSRTLLRRGKGDGYAEVDFVGIDNLAYRARWSVRRARSKSQGRLQNAEYLLTRLNDAQLVCGNLKSEVQAAILQRVGLSFTQFTRAVLLAQNDFATFLKADDNERAELLQTLTGTERFERLSMRVYARAGLERSRLDELNRQLAGDPPLADAERQQLERALSEARVAAEVSEKRIKALEAAQRWQQELARLETASNQARSSLEQATAARQAAGERRDYLARVDAVAPAQPLLVECDRLAAESEQTTARLPLLAKAMREAGSAKETAEAALAKASQELVTAQLAEKSAQPEIETAKRLDTEIETLAPQCLEAGKALDATLKDIAGRRAEQGKLAQQQAATTQQRAATVAWLEQHAASAVLVQDWTHWRHLLEESERAHAQHQQAQSELSRQQQTEKSARAADAQQAGKLGQCEAERRVAETALTETGVQLARFDADALAREKVVAESLRARLAEARAVWTSSRERLLEHAEAARESAALELASVETQRVLQRLAATRPGLEGQLRQAERALQQAQAACNQDVDGLRATLVAGEACPVCGGHEHPYAQTGAGHRLLELLKNHQAEYDGLRKQLETLSRDEAGQGATLKSQGRQHAALATRLAELVQRRDAASRNWAAILTNETDLNQAVQANAELLDWFTSHQDATETRLKNLISQEAELRAAQKARDATQVRLTQIQLAEQQARDASLKARESLNQALQAIVATQSQITQAVAALDGCLGQLDSALKSADWRIAWRQNPAEFRDSRQQEVNAWQARHQQQETEKRALEDIAGQLNSLAGLLEQGGEIERQQRTSVERLEQQIREKRLSRTQVLGGKSAAWVAAALAEQVTAAQIAVTAQTQLVTRCRSAATEAVTAHALALTALADLQGKEQQSKVALDAWLAAFNMNPNAPLDIAALRGLLGIPAAWLGKEREELTGLEQAVAAAETIRKERHAQLEAHRGQAVQDAESAGQDAAGIALKLAELAPLLAREKAAIAEQDVALRQDNERRNKVAALAEALRAQADTTETWARLNEVIGSATGHKFRRIAQQYTLDVLLGYANRHLADLSRRYRLERLPDSLTLLVVDQDLGDERRSVHSLSGGESFLVSLALALGLASLSSHTVRVESLFIDEGFGSLDVDTLAVAMDALDNLQTQGRKVGVISHVHEMAERIGVQIQVKPQSGGQSRLSVVG
jgi:exonuclease SbcC